MSTSRQLQYKAGLKTFVKATLSSYLGPAHEIQDVDNSSIRIRRRISDSHVEYYRITFTAEE